MKTAHALALCALALATTACSRGNGRAMIQNKGSDTLVNVAQAWAEAYKNVDPTVGIAVAGGGSGTGISAMIDGNVDIANASRKMKTREIDAAKGNGIDPIEWTVGFDALAVYVHVDNPLEKITLDQLAEIYGEDGETVNWSQLGVTLPGDKSDEIVVVSRQNNSGTYVYFKEAIMGKERDYKLGTRDMHGSKDVVELVENTPGSIGYSGLAYATEHVKMVPVVSEGGVPVSPTVSSAVDGSYPIARPLLMYTAGQPTGKVKEYLDWILSDAGQAIIQAKGYAPVRKLEGT